MTFTQPPCKDCPDRSVGCHSSCPKWKDWQAEEHQNNEKVSKAIRVERVFQEINAERSIKFSRRLHSKIVRGH